MAGKVIVGSKVSARIKEALYKLALAQGQTPSALVRQLIERKVKRGAAKAAE